LKKTSHKDIVQCEYSATPQSGYANEYLTNLAKDCFGTSSEKNAQIMGMKQTFFDLCYEKARFIDSDLMTVPGGNYFSSFCKVATVRETPPLTYESYSNSYKIDQQIFPQDGLPLMYDTFSFSIGFYSLFYNEISEVYLDSIINTAIDTLGMTGFWMGFSFITIFEVVTIFGVFLREVLGKIRKSLCPQLDVEEGWKVDVEPVA